MTKIILIAGTSSGLGHSTAQLFHANGWNVIATMRQPDKEEEFSKLDRTLVARLDVQDAATIAGAVQAGLDRFGRIDALINNAGYGAYGLPMKTMLRAASVKAVPCNLGAPTDGSTVKLPVIDARFWPSAATPDRGFTRAC